MFLTCGTLPLLENAPKHNPHDDVSHVSAGKSSIASQIHGEPMLFCIQDANCGGFAKRQTNEL